MSRQIIRRILERLNTTRKTGNVIGDPFWITQGELEFNHARISPDGQHFVAVQAKPTQDDIALFDLDGKNRRDLNE